MNIWCPCWVSKTEIELIFRKLLEFVLIFLNVRKELYSLQAWKSTERKAQYLSKRENQTMKYFREVFILYIKFWEKPNNRKHRTERAKLNLVFGLLLQMNCMMLTKGIGVKLSSSVTKFLSSSVTCNLVYMLAKFWVCFKCAGICWVALLMCQVFCYTEI